MKKIRLTIDGRQVDVPERTTILAAAATLDIEIPTLCYLDGCEATASCMVCAVHELNSNRLLPACSVPAAEGMRIETDSAFVRGARKDTLDMLLSEHVGDCQAPCQRACPAGLNIPLMIRQIKAGQFGQALVTVKETIALPAVLGRICPAPCEAACKRKPLDQAVSICLLKRAAADFDLAADSPFQPPLPEKSGKRAAVVGAGPAGLAAAYHLLAAGHECDIYEREPAAGGQLRYGVSREKLPLDVLDAEIAVIERMGAVFRLSAALGRDISLEQLRRDYDAVILASGAVDRALYEASGVECTGRGVSADRHLFATPLPGVFAGGNLVGESKRAVRAVAHGRQMAVSADSFLRTGDAGEYRRAFNSVMGRLHEGEAAGFLTEAADYGRTESAGGFSREEAVREAGRCFGCDCRKPVSCRLRRYAESFGAEQSRYQTGSRRPFERIIQHDLVVYEPGKCIKCGLCVQIARQHKEEIGLAFAGRGFEVRIAVPFQESVGRALQTAAADCVNACPAAALSWLDRQKEFDHD